MSNHIPSNAVVVGVDGSRESWNALRWAADRAAEAASPLHVMHAEGALYSTYGPTPDVNPIDNICDEALGIVQHHHPDLAVTWSQPADSPVNALVDASIVAGEIVLGTRGLGAVRGAVLGSVATRVSAAAHCPVLVIRAAFTELQSRGPVVVGVDLRPDGVAALDFAFAEADRRGLGVVAVLCWQLDRMDFASGIPMPGGNMAAAQEHHRGLLRKALAGPSARYPSVRVTPRVECAPTAETLVEHSTNASLLVVGTRGHREVTGLVLGAVSQRMMRRALCPVAVVSHTRAEQAGGGHDQSHTSA